MKDNIRVCDIVTAVAGKERGKLFVVVKICCDYCYLADGKRRRISAPKKKKRRHIMLSSGSEYTWAKMFKLGENPTDRDIRRALAAYRKSKAVMAVK